MIPRIFMNATTSTALLLALVLIPIQAWALSERSVLLKSIESDSDLELLRIDTQKDSLDDLQVRSAWLPKAIIDARLSKSTRSVTPSPIPPLTNPDWEIDGGLSLSQTIPGGAILRANGDQQILVDNPNVYANNYGLSLVQPLLNGAGRYAPQDFAIQIRRLDGQQFQQQQRQRWVSKLSDLRNAYWEAVSAQAVLDLSETQKVYWEKLLHSQVDRFKVGSSTELDTLSAYLEWLRAMQQVARSQTTQVLAWERLAIFLNTSADSIRDTVAPEIELGPVPASDELFQMAKKWDPQLQLFSLMGKKLALEEARIRNSRLPEINLEASALGQQSDESLFGDALRSSNASIGLLIRYAFPTPELKFSRQKTLLDSRSNEIQSSRYISELQRRAKELTRTWADERLQIDLSKKAGEAAQRKLLAAQKGYDAGFTDWLTLLKAQNDWSQSQLDLLRGQLALKRVEVAVDEATGEVLSKFGIEMK